MKMEGQGNGEPHDCSATGTGIVYASNTAGHRQSYLDTLGRMFALDQLAQPMNRDVFRRLVGADRVLFATMDDDQISFLAVAIARALRGRRTAALFLGAQTCVDIGRWTSLKRLVFGLIRRIPGVTTATITPFDVMPAYKGIASVGLYDPQYWDQLDAGVIADPAPTALSEDVAARAGGRLILCALGRMGANKGLDFLAETLERHPSLAERVFVVCAGSVIGEVKPAAARLSAAGALMVDRFVSDAELESLYGVSDSVWACYSPGYNSASGVFGRALQFGVPPIVKAGSVIARFATVNGLPHLEVPFGDHARLADLLLAQPRRDRLDWDEAKNRVEVVGRWQTRFRQAIESGMAGRSNRTGNRVGSNHVL